jgi:hypothetical protein
MQKTFVALAGVLLILVAMTASGRAEDYPWCTEFDPFTKNCTFANYGECLAVARTAGATCVRNSNFHAAAPMPAQQKTSHQRR